MRIDVELVKRGMFKSRNKAQNEIKNGNIYCNGKIVNKISYEVSKSDNIEIKGEILKYVSRGGLKLERAIEYFNIDLKDKVLMDIGSSTGGFTDCALQNKVKKVYAIDVGTNQIDDKLKNNSKVLLYENTDFRNININKFYDVDIASIDVSFISTSKLINKINEFNNLKEIICLAKPQFECGLEIANQYKGKPLNKKTHIYILKEMILNFKKIDFYIQDLIYSPIKGSSGNIEYLIYFKKNCDLNEVNVTQIVDEAFKKLNK